MADHDEKNLLKRLRHPGQRKDAFADLVTAYRERLYYYARHMVIDHDDALDVTQNVFIKAWNGLEKFKGTSSIYTWLYRIATNESINFLKKKRKHIFQSMDLVQSELANSLDNSPHLSGDEIQLKLEKAVLKLPLKQRTVFILRYFEDRSYAEIARITGTSEGALHASYHLAEKKIKTFLQSD